MHIRFGAECFDSNVHVWWRTCNISWIIWQVKVIQNCTISCIQVLLLLIQTAQVISVFAARTIIFTISRKL